MDLEWLTEFPQGNLGLWILFLATLGAFVITLAQLLRRSAYLEFQEDSWQLTYEAATRKATVIGRATVVSPAASMRGTCQLRWKGGKAKLRLSSNDAHLTRPNTLVLTYLDWIDLPSEASDVTVKAKIELSDGAKKTSNKMKIENVQRV